MTTTSRDLAGSPADELSPPITGLLHAWSSGDRGALEELTPLVCDELRRMARRYVHRENASHVLRPTALVDEFFVRVLKRRKVSWKNRRHFFGFAAQTMRQILVDGARRRKRQKRDGKLVALGEELEQIPTPEPSLEILAVHELLERLEAEDPRAAEIVQLRFFVGMTVKETAAALEISPATVKREWEFARLWLYQQLRERPMPVDDEPPKLE